ncbi:RNA polymerase recycling motor HelD [Alteribacter natronophilus]|uniref:RNA polymerase recycling motor HelD n=1 Tax=Alteribacter natronophilus TaxID=2583810 RepID=UPI00110E6ECD|nr:RNA polymerase recycling motor HelD [Alteribacter natronophilus]TMW70714.1 helicase [Alteribacter natronophilus]
MSEEKQWQEEQQRVDEVVETIEQRQEALKESSGEVKSEILQVRKDFWEDVTVNLDDPDDVIETQASLKQQAEFLSERERSHGQKSEQLKTLRDLHDSPYFGRIDFQEEGEQASDRVYIGIASLMDEDDEEFLIYDWRAPISSMYYNYAPGPAEYETPEGEITGEIELKRQFIIRGGQIKGLFNTGVTIGDKLLQNLLGSQSSPQMKSIVSTIQREQNQIIRNERSRYLIVQGVAGSGKTSAAMQRVAYLLYAHRESLTSENMVLFSPNPLFNSYVATVLPELGEENLWQTTFNEYVQKELSGTFNVEDPFDQMEWFLGSGRDEERAGDPDQRNDEGDGRQVRAEAVQLKSSLYFKDMIDGYMGELSDDGLHFLPVKFRGEELISKEEIGAYFYSLDSSISLVNRMDLTGDWIMQKVKTFQRDEWEKQWVEDEIQLMDKSEYLEAFRKLESSKKFTDETFDDYDREREWLSKRVVKKKLVPLKRKIKQLAFVNVVKTYRDFYVYTADRFPELKAVCDAAIDSIYRKQLNWEDATPYLYFQDQLKGRRPLTHIRHVFVDEAQDYSPFQFAYLKQLFPQARMTLLGDVNQSIYLHAVENPTPIDEDADKAGTGTERTERITLMRSYRSTEPIVRFTSQLIEGGENIIPFTRDGDLPVLVETAGRQAMQKRAVSLVKELRGRGTETMAVICKTVRECEAVSAFLAEYFTVQLVDKDTHTYQKGLVVIPAYLAKGIEFDAVILYDVSAENYADEAERNLFYTACTRAMHELYLLSPGERSPLLDRADPQTYVVE